VTISNRFYNNCKNSRTLIGLFLWSICGQTYEFEIHATRQRARAGNSTIYYRNKQIDVSFSCARPAIDNDFVITLSKYIVCGSTAPYIRLARSKFELTNQDSAGGKNSSVLM